MTQTGNILLDPLRKTFELEDDVTEFNIVHPQTRHYAYFEMNNDDDRPCLFVRGFTGTASAVCIQTQLSADVRCLYTNVPPGIPGETNRDVFAHDWLHLAEQLENEGFRSKLFPSRFLQLMRQVGGDSEYSGTFRLFSKRAGNGNWIRMKPPPGEAHDG